MAFYTEAQRAVQAQFDTQPLADLLEQAIVTPEIADDQRAFIESRDFFFLATVDHSGAPTVSYKGGDVGLVTVVDPATVAFPLYDGNGMFLSAGNIVDQAKIGLLFIDFETPNRLRVQATAELSDDDPLLDAYPGALGIVRASVESVFVNCARYIHQHQRVATSPYVPDADGAQQHPSWKRIDLLQDALPAPDQARTEAEGGVITIEDYADRLAAGES
jgi:predicted pyridoxine 5'-phosphate oxidase superfamily flavin-nucleotide-binding protein